MTREPTQVEKLRGLPWSVATNAANQVFSQFTFFGSVFVLYLNTIELTKTQIGFVLALIPFAGIVAPFIAPWTARYGYKYIFLIFYAARKLLVIPILATPWVYVTWGPVGTFGFVAGVVAIFSVVRAIEETAYLPWVQEFVPNTVRGKYSAMSNIATALVGFIAIWVAGLVLDYSDGQRGFMLLFAAGVVAGLISVWTATFIPGGAPQLDASAGQRKWRAALADSDFRRYLVGVALIVLGTAPLAAFLPLFMEEEVGLTPSAVVLLQLGTMTGALISSYLWGWASDRFGSKPVMQVGVWLLGMVPICWWLVPRASLVSLPLALAVAFLQGVANLGWGIGAGRLLFVSIVPVQMKLDYMAVYFAWTGVLAGLSQVVGGWALDAAQGLTGELWGIQLNAYVPIFALSVLFPLVAIALFRTVQGDSPVSTTQFAGIFLRGNPILAMGSMIRFYRAKEEEDAVAVTARMGQIGSRLTVDELLDALADPRFNVRFEAILAIAHMPSDPRLTAALVQILQGRSPALSGMAAWALGRVGDPAALEALRAGLDASYRSVRGYSARALGTLADQTMAPELLARLEAEDDEGLLLAYASAVGKLRMAEAVPTLLAHLQRSEDEAIRTELALAVARLVGKERDYVQLARSVRSQQGTAYAQTLAAIRKQLNYRHRQHRNLLSGLPPIEEAFARDELDEAARALGQWWHDVPRAWISPVAQQVMAEASARLQAEGAQRQEYLLLALHVLATGLVD